MSNLEDFFNGGTASGSSSAFGIPGPKNSEEFYESRNTSMSGTLDGHWVDKGRDAPLMKVVNVTSITRSGNTATVTTSVAHSWATGWDKNIQIKGADQTDYNIVTKITVLSTTTFTYIVAGTPTTPATGTITAIGQDIYAALALVVSDGGIAGLEFIARGRLPNSASIWANQLSIAYSPQTRFARGYFYSPGALNEFFSLHGGVGVGQFAELFRTDIVTGSTVSVFSLTTQFFEIEGSGNIIISDDPTDPLNNGWTFIFPLATGNVRRVTTDSSGNILLQLSLSVDRPDTPGPNTNQFIDGLGGYMTADKRIFISDLGLVSDSATTNQLGGRNLTFTLVRSSSVIRVIVPTNGEMFAADVFQDLSNDTGDGAGEIILITTWSNSVLILADDRDGATSDFHGVYGRRLFDRVDFDRWLTAVCDFLNMPRGEDFFV